MLDVTINWESKNNDVVYGYEVHRSQTSGFTPDSSSKVADVASTVNTYTEALGDGTYYYKIVGFNQFFTKPTSNQKKIVVQQ